MFFNSTKANKHSNTAVAERVVINSRWIDTNLLELGMYVNELDKPWEETRFVFQGFRIDSYETLRAVQAASEYANVQIEKVALVPLNSANRLVASGRDTIFG